MKKSQLIKLIVEEMIKYKKGLYQAKVGDSIKIGQEGLSWKYYSKVQKILDSGKIVDSEGNIFFPNGRLYKGKSQSLQKSRNKNKEVSAQLITQEDFDDQYKKSKIDFLKSFDYSKLKIEDIEKITDAIPVKYAGTLRKSRFAKKKKLDSI